jgi:hypothetical protein
MSSRYKVLFSVIAVVAIAAIAYYSFLTPTPSSDDVTGTIGSADRYRGDQISQGDAATGDQ